MAGFIRRMGHSACIARSAEELCSEIRAGAAAAIVAEEALTGNAFSLLRPVLANQPSWSDFPLILLIAGGRVTVESERLRHLREPLGNVVLLERPARPETLSSTLETALRSRERQYQVRDQMQQVALSQEALRRSEKLAVTGRLAASIAHEINNPLEGVINLLYLMRSADTLDGMKRYLDEAEQQLARVIEITTHTLRFYREPSRPVNVDVAMVLDSILTLFHSRLVASGITVQTQVRAPRTIVNSSPGELRQALANLVGNAIDAMHGNGRLLLRLSSSHTRAGVPCTRITIADTGCGIPRELLLTIFEPFVTTKGETGTGLGLWVTQEIVKKNGWKIHVRSRTAKNSSGTVFSLLIPNAQGTAHIAA
jgi:signal transduction histidine kinase